MTDFKVGDKVEVVSYPDKTAAIQPGMKGVVIPRHDSAYIRVRLEKNDLELWFMPEELKLVEDTVSEVPAISVEAVYRVIIKGQAFDLTQQEAESLSEQVFGQLYRVEEEK